MEGVYYAKGKDNAAIEYIANGAFVKNYLDRELNVFLEIGEDSELVAIPDNTFYKNIYAETVNGDIIVATPEDGWIGLNKGAFKA